MSTRAVGMLSVAATLAACAGPASGRTVPAASGSTRGATAGPGRLDPTGPSGSPATTITTIVVPPPASATPPASPTSPLPASPSNSADSAAGQERAQAATAADAAGATSADGTPTDGAAAAPVVTDPAAPAATPGGSAAGTGTTPAALGGFVFEASAIGDGIRARMVPTSWRPGCPVPLEDLRYLRIAHWGFDGQVHLGELVVAATAVDDMAAVFGRLFAAGFPIRQMRLVDDYGGDDFTSIEADNTSAFNCRPVTGSTSGWSEHAYGRAVDVNPIENPYVYRDGTSDHPASTPFLDRSAGQPGMATDGGSLVAAFDARGWGWGGRWSAPVDYQHFSSSGR